MTKPAEQSAEHHHLDGQRSKSKKPQLAPEQARALASRHQRQGDRDAGDDDDATSLLPRYVRFRDLQSAGIVDSWEQLSHLIDKYGFPVGSLLSPNVRAWLIGDVRAWLDARPTERKVPPRRRSKGDAEQAA